MTEQQVMEFVEENDVKFIRLAFVDLFGTLKNISVMPSELSRALRAVTPRCRRCRGPCPGGSR